MSDTRDNGTLDTRIRELVARAVADAPRAPEIDPSVLPGSDPKPDNNHRGWWLGGGAAILAAASLITALLLVGDADDKVTTPATPPTVAPTPAPTPAPTVPPTTVPTTSQTPGTVVGTPTPPGFFVTAGPHGVVEHRGDETRTLTTEPMAIALDAGDDRIVVQHQSGQLGQDWTKADTIPLVLAEDGSTSPLFGASAWDGWIALHDIEVVESRRLLLYSVQTAMDEPAAADESLYVIDLDTQERTLVGRGIGGWEFGTDRLHLATTGLIVGQAAGEGSSRIDIRAVPGSPAAQATLPTAADLGLDDFYSDCTRCPSGFSVAPSGGAVAWVEDGGLVTVTLGQQVGQPERIADVPRGYVTDLELSESDAIVSIFQVPDRPPVLIPLDGGDAVELAGTTATFGPTG